MLNEHEYKTYNYSLACDGCGAITGPLVPNGTALRLFAVAKSAGWKLSDQSHLPELRDYCPTCWAKREEAG